MRTITVVDDNQIQLQAIADMIKDACSCNTETSDFAQDVSMLTYSDPTEFLSDIRTNTIRPDILFMDIQLGQQNGITVADSVLNYAPDCQIIFISGFDDYYIDVYDVEHIYFIRKPATPETVAKALAKASRGADSAADNSFSLEFNGQTHLVNLNQILYFEHYKRITTVYLSNGDHYQFYMPLKEVHNKLPRNFIRCHASFIVNLNKVSSYSKYEFNIKDKSIPISRHYRDKTREAFMNSL